MSPSEWAGQVRSRTGVTVAGFEGQGSVSPNLIAGRVLIALF